MSRLRKTKKVKDSHDWKRQMNMTAKFKGDHGLCPGPEKDLSGKTGKITTRSTK